MKTFGTILGTVSLLLSGAAFANRGVALKTVEQRGTVKERLPGGGLTVRAPIGTRLSRQTVRMIGRGGHQLSEFVQVKGKMSRNGKAMMFQLDSGRYLDSRNKKVFTIKPIPAFGPVDTIGRPTVGQGPFIMGFGPDGKGHGNGSPKVLK